MEHAEATKTKAVERYVLGEMSGPEAESFEEHYFDCSLCANDVRDEMKLLEWGRELARAEGVSGRVVPIARRRLGEWLPLVAAAVLVMGLGLPMLMRSGRAPSDAIGRQLVLQAGPTRGAGDHAVTLRDEEELVLQVDIPYEETARFSSYALVVRDAEGRLREPQTVSAKEVETGEAITLVLRGLPAGDQELTIEGIREDGSRAEIARQTFNVQY